MPRVRMADVAALANVSLATVSNTLNHPERVAEAKRRAVLDAVRALGYVPNQQARVLMGARNNVIGLVVADLLSPFYMEIAHAVERTATAAGFVVIMCNSENTHEREEGLLRTLAAQNVVGSLLTPAGGGVPMPESEHGVPLVLIDYADDQHGCSVMVDHVAGGRLAAQHLIDLGHTSLAFAAGQPRLQQFGQREQGIREAMADAGLDPHTLKVVVPDGIGIETGRAAVAELLADDPPTGICCGNDMLAFGVFRGLAQAGLRVPDDVSIVGYDDVEFADSWIVPMTSVRQPTTQMGERAAGLLLDHAINPDHGHERIVLEPELVVRASSGPVTASPM